MEIPLYPIGKVIKFQSPYALFSMRIPLYSMVNLKIFLSPTLKKLVLNYYKIKYQSYCLEIIIKNTIK